MRRALGVLVAVAFAVSLVPVAGHSIVPPRDGKYPAWYYEILQNDKNAFTFQNAWIEKTKRAKENREKYINERGFYNRQLAAPGQVASMAVTGTVSVPVFCSKFANTGADPWAPISLENKLYNGPGSPQTLSAFWSEQSYGDITMTGDVYGWTTLANNDTYYEGPSGCNGLCGTANLDDYITETLTANDGAVDFGIYDNDGPDNLPNSGDDDGIVDFVAFVHAEYGAECGGIPFNIWSHRFNLNSLLGSMWTTNDPAAGGGNIRVNDYVMQPAFNCDQVSLIDIGVFAHEYAHAFGLPDLYDTNGGSAGVGYWGLMGSGPWNTPDYPAHLEPWSKAELGWSNIVSVGSKKQAYTIPNVEFNRTVYRLDVTHERWRRMSTCALNGSFSMRCGLTAAEGAGRNWSGGDGYGDGWIEKMSRDFSYDGSNPVTLTYNYSFDSEATYDFTYVRVDVNGSVSTVATYDGTGGGSAVIDLTPYLNGSGASSYTVSFEFESDVAWSDRDGLNGTTCGPFVVDDITVNGGGESYATDFEVREDGWCADMTSPAEYFLVENRQPVGSDLFLPGGGGVVIWHINQDVTRTGQAGNQGGASGTLVQGVYPEQADGLDQLKTGNPGNAGDPFPGSTNNTTFDNATSPSSLSDDGGATNVCVINISPNPGGGGDMTATMAGSWPLPTVSGITPNVADNNVVVAVQIDGVGLVKGAVVELILGATTYTATGVEWLGKDRAIATFDLNGTTAGVYDLAFTNPGEGCHVTAGGFTINDVASGVTPERPAAYALGQNYPNPFNPATTIPFSLKEKAFTTLKIYNIAGQVVRTLVNGDLEAATYSLQWDGRNNAGHEVSSGVYFYKLESGSFTDVRKLLLMK